MVTVIDSVPTSFVVPPFADRWFSWADVAACFWPGHGRRSSAADPSLAPVRMLGGVYCFAWSLEPPTIIGPTAAAVRYVGATNEFRRRVGQFGNSAGFWGERQNGHSAGWRWPAGQVDRMWIGFFPIGNELLSHLAAGMRFWMEAVALEEYRLAHGRLPEINDAVEELSEFNA